MPTSDQETQRSRSLKSTSSASRAKSESQSKSARRQLRRENQELWKLVNALIGENKVLKQQIQFESAANARHGEMVTLFRTLNEYILNMRKATAPNTEEGKMDVEKTTLKRTAEEEHSAPKAAKMRPQEQREPQASCNQKKEKRTHPRRQAPRPPQKPPKISPGRPAKARTMGRGFERA